MHIRIDEAELAKKLQEVIMAELVGSLPSRKEIRFNLQPVIAEAVIASREYFQDVTKEAILEVVQTAEFIAVYKAAVKDALTGKFVGEVARTMISASMREAGKVIGSDKEFTETILQGVGYEKS